MPHRSINISSLQNSHYLTLLNAKSFRVLTITIHNRRIPRHPIRRSILRSIFMLHHQRHVPSARDLIRTNSRILTRLKLIRDVGARAICCEVRLIGRRGAPGDVEAVYAAARGTAFGVVVDAPFRADWRAGCWDCRGESEGGRE